MFKTCSYSSHWRDQRTFLRLDDANQAMTKVAGVTLPQALTNFLTTYTPEKGADPYVTIAMGAGETYGPNLNGDWFGTKMLQECHPTFVSDGKVFKFHMNSARDASYGKVRFAVYDPIMCRVVLLLDVMGDRLPDIKKMYDRGDPVYVSMGCAVPYDICSICRNRAKTPREYCTHLINERLHIKSDGSMAYMINPTGKFFDISWVLIPADRTAFFITRLNSADAADHLLVGTGGTKMSSREVILKAAGLTDPGTNQDRDTEWHRAMHQNTLDKGGRCPICGETQEKVAAKDTETPGEAEAPAAVSTTEVHKEINANGTTEGRRVTRDTVVPEDRVLEDQEPEAEKCAEKADPAAIGTTAVSKEINEGGTLEGRKVTLKVEVNPEFEAALQTPYTKDAAYKIGLMVKKIVSNLDAGQTDEVKRAVTSLRAQRDAEPEMGADEIKTVSRYPLPRVLSSTGALGFILKPREFQRIVLRSSGMGEEADILDRQGRVFGPEHCLTHSDIPLMGLSPDNVSSEIMDFLKGHFERKSYLDGPMSRRTMIIIKTGAYGDVFPDVDLNAIDPLARVLSAARVAQTVPYPLNKVVTESPSGNKMTGLLGGLGAMYLGYLAETHPMMGRVLGRFAGPLAPVLTALGGATAASALSDLMSGKNDHSYLPAATLSAQSNLRSVQMIPGTLVPVPGQFKISAYLPALAGAHLLSAAYGSNDDTKAQVYGYNPDSPGGITGYARDMVKNHPVITGLGAGYMMKRIPGIKALAGKHPWLAAGAMMLPWYFASKG